ncbi:hypothetical protein [Plantactinospora sp. WMMB782]|uniref:hypothetical protein n=1 Tax=Plantactinospora sp. WMMB782 TaxID=3404121 RepID=UPI003B927C5C
MLKPAVVALTTFLTVALIGAPAVAEGDVESSSQLADRMAQKVARTTTTTKAPAGTPGETVNVVLPTDASAPVRINSSDLSVSMELPDVGASRADRAANGNTVRDGDDVDLVLRNAMDAAQVITVLESASAPTSYTYRFSGAELLPLEDGRIGILPSNSRDSVIKGAAVIDAPWAVDATGKRLATSYSIDGEYLTQHITTAGAVFPVVADPSISRESWWPLTFVVTLNPADQRIIISSGGAAVGAAVGALMCSAGGLAAAACAAAGALIVTAVAESFKEYGVKEGCNWRARWVLGDGVTSMWRTGSC